MFAQQRPRSAGPEVQAAEPHRWSAAPVPAEVSLRRSRGGLEVVPGGYRAARGGSPSPQHHPQDTPAVLAAARDGSVPRARLLWAAALLLLQVIADDPPGDPDAAALAAELAGLLGEAPRPAPALAPARAPAPAPAGPPPWPAEPLTVSETRVLRYLPTHMGTPEIAAELFLSANTVKTHLRHLYRKLGAHNRREAVQRARTIGLLTAPSRRP
jgi:LuxR family maltose regulon positive regulatory protein